MTARHKKPKELTPMQKRVLRTGALVPVSAGFVLAAATAASAACCPNSQQSQQAAPQGQQEWQGQQGGWQGNFRMDDKGWQGQWTPTQGDQTPVSVVTDSSSQREWHGRQGNWQGDWRLDENGQWQGQWTPIQQNQPHQNDQDKQTQQDRNQTPQDRNQAPQVRNQTPQVENKQGATPTNATVGRILQLVNQERAKSGLQPLALNAKLNGAAQGYANQMARTGVYAHTGSDGSSPGDRIKRAGYDWSRWAENIHHRKGSPEVIMADWMKSPLHRANILDPRLKEIGIGVDASGSYWTQNFGNRG
ncbi:uncharacterized protein YkwD [Streptomyces sp. V4I8]|uniref:CAP domain-containing protein n=1 Tax=Streptomyces sp. V4I8 TaxID=3156469 RepID=UPI0035141E9E